MMRRVTISTLIFVFVIAAFAVLVVITNFVPHKVVQNSDSQKVVARKTIFGLTLSQVVLSEGNGLPDSPHWNTEVVAVFDTPLSLQKRVWIKKENFEAVVVLEALDVSNSRAEFSIVVDGSRKSVSLGSKENIELGPGISVGWSPKNSQSVYIFADDFPLKNRNQMYSVKFSEAGRYLTIPND